MFHRFLISCPLHRPERLEAIDLRDQMIHRLNFGKLCPKQYKRVEKFMLRIDANLYGINLEQDEDGRSIR